MALKKVKGQGGEAKRYISRNKACRILQLGLPEFRRLCILKGIYPREPKSRKKAQKGDTTIRTLYLRRDIQFLAHEPIIWKIREEKVHRRKLRTLESTKEKKEAEFHKIYRRPTYKLDHMVRERYPTFQHALQDLDDTLSSCFLYACFAKEKGIRLDLVNLCRRLTTEFLNYVIESRTLRKVFVTIKGYYYRAHIQGEKVTFVIPHAFHPEIPKFADIRIMGTFIEFYCTLLGFVDYKLYQSLNLHYPPKLTFDIKAVKKETTIQEEVANIVESLNIPLKKSFVDSTGINDDDTYDLELMSLKNDRKLKLAQMQQERVKKQMKLFENVKFFLGRETNKESLTFVIRSAGGLVSWDVSCGPGASYSEEDKTIAYQIVDRPKIEKKYLTRYYIQPQWVYDSFNNGILLPVQDYFVGAELPAHLSPFEETYSGTYVPPEMQRLRSLMNQIELVGDKNTVDDDDDELSSSEDEEEEKKLVDNKEEEVADPSDMVEKELSKEEQLLSKMRVLKGKPMKRNLAEETKRKEKEDYRLATTFIHRKQKRLFKKIVVREKAGRRKGDDLKRKRIVYETEMQKRRKLAKKAAQKQIVTEA